MQKNGMATAALVLGIASMVLAAFFGIGMIPGALGLTLALLSRQSRMNTPALIGLIFSIMGTILSLVILICIIAFISSPEISYEINEYLEKFPEDFETYPDDSIYDYNENYPYDEDYIPYEYYGFDEYYDYFGSSGDFFGFDDDYYSNDYYEGGHKL